ERRHRSRRHPEVFQQSVRRRKTQLAVADLVRHGAKVGAFSVREDHQVMARALLVAEKQILAVHGLDARPVNLALLRRRDRRMLMWLERNPEARQIGGDAILLRRHGTSTAAPSIRPPRRSASASLARSSGYVRVCVWMATREAMSKNSRPSRRVRLA